MKKTRDRRLNSRSIPLFLIFCFFLILPLVVGARTNTGLVPCTGDVNDACNFEKFLALASKIFHFLLWVVIPASTISIVYAGALYVIYPTNEIKRKSAHDILTWAVVGLVITLAGYLIIVTIIKSLTGDKLDPLLDRFNIEKSR